jgi:predicted ATPase
MLLVLDNCEHLLGSCAELAHGLLSACEGVRILATSREPLKVTGELTRPVPGLALPDTGSLPPVEELHGYAAVRLFVERAGAVQPGFALEPDDAEAVVGSCRRLDGMPLAIELAAARARTLSPGEILERLYDRFRLLTGGGRDALARQRTLLATVEWSHDLLSTTEQTLFRRLSVFAGGWTVADAEQVCGDDYLSTSEVLDVLCGLVDKSLVVAEPISGGPSRYRLLETLRDYAAGRLAAAREDHALRRRHFEYFLALAEGAHEQKLATGSDAGMAVVASQLENLRAGLAFAQAADPHGLLRLATAMEDLWLAGNLGEGRRWLEDALAQASEPTLERARALQAAVSLASHQQDHAQVRQWANENLALSASLDDNAGEAWARQSLGFVEWAAGDHDAAVRHLKQSLAMHEARGDRLGACRSLLFLGTALTYIPGRKEQGRIELERGLQAAREIDDAWGEGFAGAFLGFADTEAGEPELAASRFRGAAMIAALGPIRGVALDGLALLAVDHDPPRALRLLGAATAHRQRHAGRPPPHFSDRREAIRAQAEQRIDPAAAQQAWSEGLRMTTQEAVAYALGD